MSPTRQSDLLREIREVNLLYLQFVQRLLREDRAAGARHMGIPEELADLLANLSLAQTERLAASNQLLCRFRFDDLAILSALAGKGAPGATPADARADTDAASPDARRDGKAG